MRSLKVLELYSKLHFLKDCISGGNSFYQENNSQKEKKKF